MFDVGQYSSNSDEYRQGMNVYNDLCRQMADCGISSGRRRFLGAPRQPASTAARCRGRVRRLAHLQVRRPAQRAQAIVQATTFFDDSDVVAKVLRCLGGAMVGLNFEGSHSRAGRRAPAR